MGRASAERHADADLAPSLGYRIVQDAVQPDRREHQGDDTKEQRERGEQPFAQDLPLEKIALWLDVDQPEIGTHL